MIVAHIGGVPVEEMLPLTPGAGVLLLLLRAQLMVRLRARREPGS